MSDAERPKNTTPAGWLILIGLSAAICGGFYWNHWSKERAREAREAVSVLPAGIAEAYRAHVEDSIAQKVRFVEGGMLIQTREAISPEESQRATRYVPNGAPFYMVCQGMIEAHFASGDEVVTLAFIDFLDEYDDPPRRLPPRGVPHDSIAARTLDTALCEQARTYLAARGFVPATMQEVMTANMPN
jgi:hypothetical protein